MKYISYCRKSSEDESHQAQSIETQRRILKEFSENNKLEIVKTFIETKSAKDDGNRAEFEKMLECFKNGEADGLLVCHIDRISRNLIEAGIINKFFDLGIIKEVRTPSKIYNTISDFFMMGIELVSASNYSRALSQRVREGIETKLRKGEYTMPAPLGYKNNHGNIIPNISTMGYVQKAFQLYSTGEYSINQITEILYSEGFRTSRGNKKVYKAVVHRILTNPIYYGLIIQKGKEYRGSFEPLVSEALFNKVQFMLKKTNHTKKQKHDFLFRNYLICEKCGCKFTATIKKGKHSYYYCTNGKHVCNEHFKYLTEKEVDDLISVVMSDITIPKEISQVSLELYLEDLKKENYGTIQTSKNIEIQLDLLNKKKNRLLDLLLNQSIDQITYEAKKREIEEETESLKDELNAPKTNNFDMTLELLTKFRNGAICLGNKYRLGNRKTKEELLKSVLWNATIENQKVQNVTYKKPYEYLKKAVNSDDFSVWRALCPKSGTPI